MPNGMLAICVPSRGRRKVFGELLASFNRTATPRLSTLIVRNGEKDPTKHEYDDVEGLDVIRYTGTDDGFNSTWEGTAGYAPALQDIWQKFPDYSYYLAIEDDCVFIDEWWDQKLVETINRFPNRIGLVHMDDITGGIHSLAVSHQWCQTLGYFMRPDMGEVAWEHLMILSQPDWMETGPRIVHNPQPRDGYRNDQGFAQMNPKVLQKYREQEQYLHGVWMPNGYAEEREKLEKARLG